MQPQVSPAQFLDLYERAFRDVYSYVASRLGDRAASEDVTQEVFISAARHFTSGGDVNIGWLKTVARSKLIDHFRGRARQDRKLEIAYSAASAPAVSDIRPDDATRVAQALEQLNPTYRAALVLRHVDGMSVPEVSELLARSVEATEQVLSRARAAFRTAYAQSLGADNE